MSRVTRWGSLAVSASLLAAGLAVPAHAVEPPTIEGASAATVDDVAQQTAHAVQAARASGVPVPVEGLTSPTEQTRAMPDGSFQYEVSNAPVRVEEEGEWVAVDTDLEESGGWLVPEATVAPVRFATGGSDILAEVQMPSGEWITEVWPHGDLPAPTIDDATATYREVLPGVDVKLTATEIGMTTVYVVKNEKAAKSDKLRTLGVDVEGARLSKTTFGRVRADGPGSTDATSAPPLWWDASNGGDSAGPGGDDPLIPVVHEVTEDRVSMDVAATVESEDITYPLYVDPDWSTGQSASWYTDAKYPNQGYLATGAGYILRVGVDAGGGWYSNAFFQFPISALRGKQILGATMNTTQLKALFCAPSSIEVRAYGPQNPGFSWNGTAGGWGPVLHNQNPGTCGSPAMAVGWNVTGGVQSHVGANMDVVQFAITYPAGSNTSRRHFDWAASLVVNYNTPPNTPTNLAIVSPQRSCGTASAPAILSATDVTVSFTQTDPDPENVDTNVYLHKTSDLVNAWQHRNPGLGAQGAKSVTFNGLANGQAYAWRARGSDWKIDGASFSGWCYFTVDNTAPAAPTVTSAATTFTVGRVVDADLSGSVDVAGYQYWLAYGAPAATPPAAPVSVSRTTALPDCTKQVGGTRFACGAGATAVRVSIAPTDSLSTLWVAAYDKAGNVSSARALKLYSTNGTPATRMPGADDGHMWQTTSMPSPLPTEIPDSNPWAGTNAKPLVAPPGVGLTTTDAVLDSTPSAVVRLGPLPNAGDALMTTTAPVNATNSFTLSAWVKPTTTTDQMIAIQAGPGRGRVELKLVGGKYAFCILGSAAADDGTKPVSGCATAPTTAVVNSWAMVTGVWDAANKQIRLVLGASTSPVAVAPHVVGSGDWSANGPLMFGPSPESQRFTGLIANPVVVPSILDTDQMAELSYLGTPFTS
jgi:hypothetical protein